MSEGQVAALLLWLVLLAFSLNASLLRTLGAHPLYQHLCLGGAIVLVSAERIQRIIGDRLVTAVERLMGLVLVSVAILAIVGTAIAGALLGTVFTHWMDQRHADWLQGQLDRGGILLWVRARDDAAERQAMAILTRYSAHDVHIHELPTGAPDGR